MDVYKKTNKVNNIKSRTEPPVIENTAAHLTPIYSYTNHRKATKQAVYTLIITKHTCIRS